MIDPEKREHRIRLRKRFAQSRFEGFHNYEVLEILLFEIIPIRDVKPVAKRLIEKFGSFAQVLDAPAEELIKVKGVGPADIELLGHSQRNDCLLPSKRCGCEPQPNHEDERTG